MAKRSELPAALLLWAVDKLRDEGFANLKEGVVIDRAKAMLKAPASRIEWQAWAQLNLPDEDPALAGIAARLLAGPTGRRIPTPALVVERLRRRDD